MGQREWRRFHQKQPRWRERPGNQGDGFGQCTADTPALIQRTKAPRLCMQRLTIEGPLYVATTAPMLAALTRRPQLSYR